MNEAVGPEQLSTITGARRAICGIMSNSGPNGEPLACAYTPGHDGPHSWSTLPTFPLIYQELPKLPEFTTFASSTEPLMQFGRVWVRISEVQAVSLYEKSEYIDAVTYIFLSCGEQISIDEESSNALLAYLKQTQEQPS